MRHVDSLVQYPACSDYLCMLVMVLTIWKKARYQFYFFPLGSFDFLFQSLGNNLPVFP